ncbi:MAG: hypothetical protein FJ161_03865 [Gammaproteobacteria bacterium]|nr:hypothetical protein [Gammaproteobacteria bacterium]
MMRKMLWIFAASLLAAPAWAGYSIDWTVDPSDQTYQYLTFLFGNVSNDLMCTTSSCTFLVPQFFAIFNQGLLTIGSIVMTYVLLVSTGSSAHEGEFMGKKGSSLWLPFRIIAGVSFMVPSSTGYSVLQIFIMRVVLMGVALANTLYTQLESYVMNNDRTFAKEFSMTIGADPLLVNDLTTIASQIFSYELCYASYAAAQPLSQDVVAGLNSGLVLSDSLTNGPTFLNCPNKFFGCTYTVDRDEVRSGCDFVKPSIDLCGTWKYTYSKNENRQIIQPILETLSLNLRGAAQLLVEDWIANQGNLKTAASVKEETAVIQAAILQAVGSLVTGGSISQNQDQTLSSGSDWMNFPMDYYKWIDKGSGSYPEVNTVTTSMGPAMGSRIGDGLEDYKNLKTNVLHVYEFFDTEQIQQAAGNGSRSGAFSIDNPGSSGGAAVGYTFFFIKKMLSGAEEPLISLAVFGQKLLKIAVSALMTAVILGGLMVVGSAICASVSSGFAVGLATAIPGFFISLALAFGMLIPMGVSLGIYLPMIPGMTYCSGVIVWFLMVIESMVAGPIIALGLTAPGQDALGKSEPAILMLFNVFLRPSLMVMGMVFGAKMFDLFAIYFTNVMLAGFTFIGNKAGFDAWYGLIFMVFWFFYAFSIVGIAQRCYSLIYILPDKVITWIGGHGGSSREVQEDLQVMHQAIDKGGDQLKSQLTNVASGFMQLSDSLLKDKKRKSPESGPAPTGDDDNPPKDDDKDDGKGGKKDDSKTTDAADSTASNTSKKATDAAEKEEKDKDENKTD